MENGELWHVLAVGLPLDFKPPNGDEDIVDLSRRAARSGAFIGLTHPSWNGMTVRDAERLPFAHAVEVYNHGSESEVARGDGWGLCDQLLNLGHRVSGFAVDDSHAFDNDFGGGWVHVKAKSLDPDALLDALKRGLYYSSQGPLIHDIRIDDQALEIDCSPACNISLLGRGSKSENRFSMGATQARFELARYRGEYVRVTVTDTQGRRAWSNPVWLD
jgi:hypothetical protein